MFGHRWQRAEGTIVDSRVVRFVPVGHGFNELPIHEFVVDVRLPNGDAFRATVEEPTSGKIAPPDVGAVVGVNVDPKSRQVVFDDNDPRLSVDAQLQALRQSARDRFEGELGEPPGTA